MFKSAKRPRCHWCGKPITKHTVPHSVMPKEGNWTGYTGTRPTTKAEVQKLTNERVTAVDYAYETDINFKRTGRREIDRYWTWDGESYVDGFFCSGECAKKMGYAAAHKGWTTKAYREAFPKDEEAA